MIALLAVLACNTTAPVEFATCDIQLSPTPEEANPGDVIDLVGGPASVPFDTVVTIAGLDAEVVDITREGCQFCDACRSDNGCLSCQGTCIACEELCAADCIETTRVQVPPAAPFGETSIAIVNTFGTGTTPFLVLGAPPTPTGDTGQTPATGDTSGADTSGADTSDTSMTGDTGP